MSAARAVGRAGNELVVRCDRTVALPETSSFTTPWVSSAFTHMRWRLSRVTGPGVRSPDRVRAARLCPRRSAARACLLRQAARGQHTGPSGVGDRVTTTAAQDDRAADGDRRADQRPGDVYPVGGPVAADQRRAERARRVHRGAADRRRPQAGQGDIAADAERADPPTFCAAEAVPRITLSSPAVSAISIRNACQSW